MTDAFDAIAPDQVQVVNSPNVLTWPVTTTITRLELRTTGVHLEFDAQARWPDVTPPGWTGPLQYTLWLLLNIGGQWVGSGIIQFWRGLQEGGGDVTANRQIATNWIYDERWAPMTGHQPSPGALVGFLVSAGNARNQDDHLVAERSNIVQIAFPERAGASYPPFVWSEVEPDPPAPAPVPNPTPTPEPHLSSLDGIAITGIDTDPDSNLYMTISGMKANGLEIVGVLPRKFYGVRDGYLVVSYDRTKDPRAAAPQAS